MKDRSEGSAASGRTPPSAAGGADGGAGGDDADAAEAAGEAREAEAAGEAREAEAAGEAVEAANPTRSRASIGSGPRSARPADPAAPPDSERPGTRRARSRCQMRNPTMISNTPPARMMITTVTAL
jgi:hypothetical protein